MEVGIYGSMVQWKLGSDLWQYGPMQVGIYGNMAQKGSLAPYHLLKLEKKKNPKIFLKSPKISLKSPKIS